MNANLEEMIEAVAGAKNLHEAGERLVEFVNEVEGYGDEELEEALSLLWTVLIEHSADDLNFDSPDNHGYLICPPEKLVATDLCNRIPFFTEPKENLEAVKKTAKTIRAFGRTSSHQLLPETVQKVMDDFEERFGIISKLTAKHRMLIFLHDVGPAECGGELLFHYYSDINTTIAHMAFYPFSVRFLFTSIVGTGEEFAMLLAHALCFAAFHTDHRSYRHVLIPEEIYPLLSACGYAVCGQDEHQAVQSRVEEALEIALMIDSPYSGMLTKKRERDMGEEKAEAHRKLLQAVLDKVDAGTEK